MRHSPFIRWLSKLSVFTLGQVVIQLLAAATGFLLVHALTKQHYAWFTISNTMAASVSVLSDSGVSVALTSRAGALWNQPAQFASLIAAGLRMRRTLIGAAIAVTLPWTFWLLVRNGCPPTSAALLVVVVSLGMIPATSTAVINVASRMHGRVTNLLALDAVTAISRLALIAICLPFHYLSVITATLATTLSQVIQFIEARRRNLPIADWRHADHAQYRGEVAATVRQFIPNSIFTTVQGNLTTWLVGWFSVSESVADMGALSRMSFVFVFLGLPVSYLLGPAFSRCQDPALLARRAFQIVSLYTAASVAPVVLAWMFPRLFLNLLGAKYANLSSELVWMTCLLAFSSVNQLIWGLVMAKGWIRRAWLQIPSTILLQVIFLKSFPLSSVTGVIQFGIASTAPPFLLGVVTLLYGLQRAKRQGRVATSNP